MVSVIAWKEWRQQVAFVFAILALAGIGLASSAYFAPHEWERRSLDASAGAVWVILLIGLAIAQGVVTGALLFAGEAEDGTQDFLDQHAALRAPVWKAKMLAGTSLVGFSALALGGLLAALDLKSPLGLSACVWFALDALAWSALCSMRRKTTFGAIGVALAVFFVVAGLPLSLAVSSEGNIVYAAYFGVKIPLLLLALALSWWHYSAADFQRIRSSAQSMTMPNRLKIPSWLNVALWHLWARRKGTLALLAVGPFVIAYFTRGSTPLLAWPIGTFLLGCIAGWAVFADEQAAGAERFLGDQRFPRARLWLGKTVPLLTLAIFGSGLALILSFSYHSRSREAELNPALFYPSWAYMSGNIFVFVSYALSFVVLGFGIAQLATQQTRKMPVAIFLTLALGAIVAGLWYPSLFAGLPAWRVWLIPVVLSLASLWLLPRWTSGRLHDRGGIVRLAGLAALAALWLGGNLWWRAAQFPDPGEPFDAKAYWTSLTESPDTHGAELREAGLVLKKCLDDANEQFSRKADIELRKRMAKGQVPVPRPERNGENAAVPLMFFEEPILHFPNWEAFRADVLRDGLPKELGPWSEYLDFVFAGEWVEPFKKAALAPPDRFLLIGEMVSRPSQADAAISGVFEGVDLFLIRFLVRVRASQTQAALDDLDVALAAIRHTVHRCGRYYVDSFLAANRRALFLADSTFDLAASDAAFRARLIEILARHDEAWPDFAGIVKSDYFAQAYPWSRYSVGSPENGAVQRTLIDAPWERVRFEGLRQRTYAALLAEAEAKRFPHGTEHPKLFEEYFGRPPIFTPNMNQDHWNYSNLYQNPIGWELIPLLHERSEYASNVAQIRELRLVLAAVAYEADQGRPIESLNDLVPRYFKQLPESPFRGGAFEARITDERENVYGHYGAPLRSPVTNPGQVVIFETTQPGERFVVPTAVKK